MAPLGVDPAGRAGPQGADLKRGRDEADGAGAGAGAGPAAVAQAGAATAEQAAAAAAAAEQEREQADSAYREERVLNHKDALFTLSLADGKWRECQITRAAQGLDKFQKVPWAAVMPAWKWGLRRSERLVGVMQARALAQLPGIPCCTLDVHGLNMEGVVAWIAYGLHYAGWVGVPGAPVHLTFIVGQGWHSEPRGGVRKCIARQTVLDKLRDLQVPHFLDADNRGVVHALVVGSPELAQAVAKLLEA